MGDKALQEFGIFAQRYMHFMNVWTIYSDLLSKKYVPTLNSEGEHSVSITMMFLLYSYFYSLIEDSEDGVNGFRIWRVRFPDECPAIDSLEAQVAPLRKKLKLFRNRLGFHGSRTVAHQARAFDLFADHSGTQLWNAITNFKALGAALFAKANARQGIGQHDPDQIRSWIDSVAERARQQTKQSIHPSTEM